MIKFTQPMMGAHWTQIITMYAAEKMANDTRLITYEYFLSVPNGSGSSVDVAVADLHNLLNRLNDRLEFGTPVLMVGAIIEAPEGAVAVVRVLAHHNNHQWPTDIHDAIRKTLVATQDRVPVMFNRFASSKAIQLFELTGGVASQVPDYES